MYKIAQGEKELVIGDCKVKISDVMNAQRVYLCLVDINYTVKNMHANCFCVVYVNICLN